MPARARTIGPGTSEDLAGIIRDVRRSQGLSMPALSALMHERGYPMSAATINAIENGISLRTRRRTRLVTVDELEAFITVLGIPAQKIIDWLYNDIRGKR